MIRSHTTEYTACCCVALQNTIGDFFGSLFQPLTLPDLVNGRSTVSMLVTRSCLCSPGRWIRAKSCRRDRAGFLMASSLGGNLANDT